MQAALLSVYMPVTGNTLLTHFFILCGSDTTGKTCFVFDADMKALCNIRSCKYAKMSCRKHSLNSLAYLVVKFLIEIEAWLLFWVLGVEVAHLSMLHSSAII